MQALLRGLEAHMPEGVEWTHPVGGYTLWLIMRDPSIDERSLCDRLLGQGVKVVPGSIFFARPPSGARLRLSIACVDEEKILDGCSRLGRVLSTVARG